MRWGMGINHIEQVIQTFAVSTPREELEKGASLQRIDYDAIFSSLSVVIRYLTYFGFCSYVPITEVNKKINTGTLS